MAEVVATKQSKTFLATKKRTTEMNSIARNSGKLAAEALIALSIKAADPNVSAKEQVNALKGIIDYHIKVLEIRNEDEIMRLEKELEHKEALITDTKTGDAWEDDEDDDSEGIPYVNFDEVVPINA